ncbi:MAG: 50S ribosomal protein L15 [Candidatus Omnitrophica bacterium]|nr:50S ribosomal protein L15 [Candidatus Omnitrophota bacterium]
MKAKTPYKKKPKRRGLGIGSGTGKTAGKGHKGQRARSGAGKHPAYEGGQNPLYRRLPKRGFNRSALRIEMRVVNLETLAGLGVKEVTPQTLQEHGIIKNVKNGVKVLGTGDLKSALNVSAHSFSESAKQKIEQAGGQAILLKK